MMRWNMSDLSKTTTPEAAASDRTPRGHLLRRVFIGDQGVRAGWSMLLFAAIYLLLQALAVFASTRLRQDHRFEEILLGTGIE